jgi:valyl-tRNA synthetase
LAEYRFHEAANLVYQFFWGDVCAWYIEAVKPRFDFSGDKRQEGRATLRHLTRIFEASLRLLSPFMPFITEEIWHALYQQKAPAKSIALTRFPIGAELTNSQKSVIAQMEIVQQLIVDIRNRRAELDVKPKEKTPVRIFAPQASTRALIESNRELLEGLANVAGVEFAHASMSKLPGVQSKNAYEVAVVYEKKIDVALERERLSKELKKLESESANNQRQLGNEAFLAKAPPPIVDGLRRRRSELEELLPKTRAALEELNKTSSSSHT